MLPKVQKDVISASNLSNAAYEFACRCDALFVGRKSLRRVDRMRPSVYTIPFLFHIGLVSYRIALCLHDTIFISYRIGFISDWPSVYTIPFLFHIGLVSYRIALCLHDTVFISDRIGFISDWPSVYTIPFSFHIGVASCLYENTPIRYASYRFRVFK